MIISVNNSKVTITNPSHILISELKTIFTFKDKSKDYQLSKMAKNPYFKNSKAYFQLMKEINICLLEENEDSISFPAPLLYLTDLVPNVDDRKETGSPISLPWVSQSKAIKLRDYQKLVIDKCLVNNRGIINMATGLGKSKTAIFLLRELKKKALIVAPNKSIANQLYSELCDVFGKQRIGFYGSGKKKLGDITVGIAQTVTNHVEDFKKADLGVVIVDESHHCAAATFYTILNGLADVGRIYGLTATAYRSDGKDLLLNAACGHLLVEYDAKWGIENGHLAKPIFIMRNIKTNAQDFSDKLLAYKSHILSANEITNQIESDARKMIQAKKSTLIIVDSIAHGEKLSKALGVPFMCGEDKKSSDYVDQLNNLSIPALVATEGACSEGVDTRVIECLIMGQFTAAKGAVLQAVGRGLRKQDDKTHCIILDYNPISSKMLSRHANKRLQYYAEISDQIKIV